MCAVLLLALAGELAIAPARESIANPPGERFGTDTDPAAAGSAQIAAFVRRITKADDRIWVATGADTNAGQAIYWLADRRPAARLIYPGDMEPPTYTQVGVALAQHPPTAIVILPNAPVDYLQRAIHRARLHRTNTVNLPEGDQAEVLGRRG